MATINREQILKILPEPGSDADYDERLEKALASIRGTSLSVDEDDVRVSVGVMLATERGLPIEKAFKPVEPEVPLEKVAETTEINLEQLAKSISNEDKDFFWEPAHLTQMMDLYIDMNEHGLMPPAMMSIGPSGQGKTQGFIRSFIKHGIEPLVVHCATLTDQEKPFGHKEIDEGGTKYIPSDLIVAIQKPGATILDEFTRAHPMILNAFLSLTDDQRRVQIPEMSGLRGEPFYIYRHQKHMIVATANLGSGYDGTYKMDVAMMRRFPWRLRREFPPAAEEIKVLMHRTGISKANAETLVWVAGKSRTSWKNEKISRPVDTGSLIAWAVLVSAGMPISQAAEFSVIAQYRDETDSNEDVVQIKAFIEGKGQ